MISESYGDEATKLLYVILISTKQIFYSFFKLHYERNQKRDVHYKQLPLIQKI